MPEATQYITDTKAREWLEIEDAYVHEQRERVDHIDQAWRYYRGRHHKPLALQSDGMDDNVIINSVGALVDKAAWFLLGDGVEFDASSSEDDAGQQEQSGTQDAADQAIEALWRANRGDILQGNLAVSGGVEGHVILRLKPQEGEPWPKLERIGGQHFAAFWDTFDVSRVLWYRLQHVSGGVGRRVDYVRGAFDGTTVDHTADGWTEFTYELARATSQTPLDIAAKWTQTNVQPWDYPWAPLTDWQHRPDPTAYYGANDVDSAMQLNDSMNFLLSNIMRILKHYADPKTVITGATLEDVVKTTVGGLYAIASADARVSNLEMQSDLSSSMNLAGLLSAALWQSAGMVDPQAMKDKIGALTNFGLRVLYIDAIKATDRKRALWGEGLEAVCKHALELAGKAVPARVEVVWPDVLPQDMAAESTRVLAEVGGGILSKQSGAEALGYDWQQESDRMDAEQSAGDNIGATILSRFEQGGASGGFLARGMQQRRQAAQAQMATEEAV